MLALTVGIAIADVASSAALAALLAVPPLLAATVLDWRSTAVVAATATVLSIAIDVVGPGSVVDGRSLTRLAVVVSAAAFSTRSAWW